MNDTPHYPGPNAPHAPYGSTLGAANEWGQPTPPKKTAWYKRTWVIAVAAALVGVAIGSAGASATDVTSAPEYKAVVEDRDAAEAALSDTRDELSDAQSELSQAKTDLESIAGEVPAREEAVEKAESAVAAREDAVTKKEKSVTKREKAVGTIETTIEDNTISGDGVYEVGVDMKAGQYKSAGSADCYYSVNGDANGNNIFSNNITSGPALVTVSSGEFFETQRCADWVWQR